MANLVISDHHFYHLRIIELCNRPFLDVPAMNEFMVAEWNSVAQPVDTVYYVGDFSLAGHKDVSLARRIFLRLNGHKHLIRGNHDPNHKTCLEIGWSTVQSQLRYTTTDGYRILLQHRPWEDDSKLPGVEVVVHGHIHNRPTRRAHININVSVEALNYRPVDLDELVRKHMTTWGYQHPPLDNS